MTDDQPRESASLRDVLRADRAARPAVEGLERRAVPSGSSFLGPAGPPDPGGAYTVTPVRDPTASHKGFDFVLSQFGDRSVAVPSAETGTVVLVKEPPEPNDRSYGNEVIVAYDDGTAQLFGHLASVDVAEGDSISQGDSIGIQGNTGHVIPSKGGDGTHVHTEIGVYDFKRHRFIRNPDLKEAKRFVLEYETILELGEFAAQQHAGPGTPTPAPVPTPPPTPTPTPTPTPPANHGGSGSHLTFASGPIPFYKMPGASGSGDATALASGVFVNAGSLTILDTSAVDGGPRAEQIGFRT